MSKTKHVSSFNYSGGWVEFILMLVLGASKNKVYIIRYNLCQRYYEGLIRARLSFMLKHINNSFSFIGLSSIFIVILEKIYLKLQKNILQKKMARKMY